MLQTMFQILMVLCVLVILYYLLQGLHDQDLENMIAQYEESKEKLKEIVNKIESDTKFATALEPQNENLEILRGV